MKSYSNRTAMLVLCAALFSFPVWANRNGRDLSCLGDIGCGVGPVIFRDGGSKWRFSLQSNLANEFYWGLQEFFRKIHVLGEKDSISEFDFNIDKTDCSEGRLGVGDLYCKSKLQWNSLTIKRDLLHKNQEISYFIQYLYGTDLELELIPHIPQHGADYLWDIKLKSGQIEGTESINLIHCIER